jgi:hypothetical protein
MSSEETERLPNGGHARIGQRDSGRLAGTLSARWSGTEPAISRSQEVGRGCGQTRGKTGRMCTST